MSITTTTVKYRFESVETSTYVGDCYNPDTNSYMMVYGPAKPQKPTLSDLCSRDTHFYTETTEDYIGCVVEVVGKDVRVMSDVWEYQNFAVVYDISTGGFKNVFVGGYEFSRDSSHIVTVDATPEVKEAYVAFQKGEMFRYSELQYDQSQYKSYLQRITPNKGKYVEVVKGRKVPRGTKGLVFWCGTDNYGNNKVGIATTSRKDARNRYADVVWTAASNCKVVNNYTF